jgi:plasmid stabilization system protein ParE
MIERVIYTPEAGQDVADAYSWYEAREPGLGEKFLRCVEACALTIQRHPQLYPVSLCRFGRLQRGRAEARTGGTRMGFLTERAHRIFAGWRGAAHGGRGQFAPTPQGPIG